MTDFLATVIVTLGFVPVVGLCIIAFFSAITGTALIMRKGVKRKVYHAITSVVVVTVTCVCVYYYFQALNWLLRG